MVEWSFSSGKKKEGVAGYQNKLEDLGVQAFGDNHLQAHQELLAEARRILSDQRDEADALTNPRRANTIKIIEINRIVSQVSVYAQGGEGEREEVVKGVEAWVDEVNAMMGYQLSTASDEAVDRLTREGLSNAEGIFQKANTHEHVTPTKAFLIQVAGPNQFGNRNSEQYIDEDVRAGMVELKRQASERQHNNKSGPG
jgi:hypothetical protein